MSETCNLFQNYVELNNGAPVKISDQERDLFENSQNSESEAEVMTSKTFEDADRKEEWNPNYTVGTEVDVFDNNDQSWKPATVTDIGDRNYTVM